MKTKKLLAILLAAVMMFGTLSALSSCCVSSDDASDIVDILDDLIENDINDYQ